MTEDIAIKVDNLSKIFRLPHEKNSSLKSVAVNFYRRNKGYDLQKALENVSFEVHRGEFFGIVGRNGSGKSTLLKLLAGIYSPTSGGIQVNGSLTPFIELGVGFNMELTGRENVFLNGALLGFSRKEMTAMYDSIVEFAELEKFMDQKLKNYSSGMQVRLAFSIAIRARSDILLIDEVLAVGDANFQKKCTNQFVQIKSQGVTVVFVSHDMSMVERFCDRAVLINNGKVITIGKSSEVAREYEDFNLEQAKNNRGKKKGEQNTGNSGSLGNNAAKISCEIADKNGKAVNTIGSNESVTIKVKVDAISSFRNAILSFTLENVNGQTIFAGSTKDKKMSTFSLNKGQSKDFVLNIQNIFGEGEYIYDVEVATANRETIFGHVDNAAEVDINVYEPNGWLMRPSYEVVER